MNDICFFLCNSLLIFDFLRTLASFPPPSFRIHPISIALYVSHSLPNIFNLHWSLLLVGLSPLFLWVQICASFLLFLAFLLLFLCSFFHHHFSLVRLPLLVVLFFLREVCLRIILSLGYVLCIFSKFSSLDVSIFLFFPQNGVKSTEGFLSP